MIKFNIRMLRILNDNISQAALSEKTGIRLPTLQSYEHSNTKTISVKHLEALCEAFNCDVSDIITFIPDVDLAEDESKHDIIRLLIARITKLEKQFNEHISNHSP